MPQTDSISENFPDTDSPYSDSFSPAYVANLLSEIVTLQEQLHGWKKRAFNDRREARRYKKLHQKAADRLLEKEQKIEALQSKVAELTHRVFGRKSERSDPANMKTALIPPKRKRGQQEGAMGHGRTVRENLPVIEIELDPPSDQIICACCGKNWVPLGEPEVAEQIKWEVHVVRHRTKRNKYRRPDGCTCEDGRPDVVCAPSPVRLIPKGLLDISFIVQVLLLKYRDATPFHRILGMLRSEGMPLSAGTLCGVFERIAPLFLPLYEGIFARSRSEDLALMDETRWAIFIEEAGKLSHRWWLWVVVTRMTRLYILSPSRSGAVPKNYFGYDEASGEIDFHKQLMVDRYKAYAFLKDLLALAYCWAHVRRDFLEARSDAKEREWADGWVDSIGHLYQLNKARMALACVPDAEPKLPAPFVQLDPARMKSPAYMEAHRSLDRAVKKMADSRRCELEDKNLRTPRRKILQSMEAHWHGLTLFVDQAQIPMDNNGAERVVRPAAIARKNYYGSGSKWSGNLLVWLMTLLQTLSLHKVDPRKYLTAYLQACADNGAKAPKDIGPWMPWNFDSSKSKREEVGSPNGPSQGTSP